MKSFFDRVKSEGRTALAIGLAAGAIGFAGAAYADPPHPGGNFSIQGRSIGNVITSLGQDLFGIFNMHADQQRTEWEDGHSGTDTCGTEAPSWWSISSRAI